MSGKYEQEITANLERADESIAAAKKLLEDSLLRFCRFTRILRRILCRYGGSPCDLKFQYGGVGLSTREEIDISEGGKNFGWPYWEGTAKEPESGGG